MYILCNLYMQEKAKDREGEQGMGLGYINFT